MASLLADLFRTLYSAKDFNRSTSSQAKGRAPLSEAVWDVPMLEQLRAGAGEDTLALLCDRYWQIKDYEKLEKLIAETEGSHGATSVFMLYQLLLAGRGKESSVILKELRSLLCQFPDAPLVHCNLADLYLRDGQLPAAEYHLRRVLRRYPEHPAARYGYARLLALRGLHGASVAHFQCAASVYGDVPEFVNDYANILMVLGRVDEAIGLYQHVIALSPDLVGVRNNLAMAYASLNRYAEALGVLEDALSVDSTSPLTLRNLADVYLELGELELAERFACAALEKEPDNSIVLFVLGTALIRQSRAQAAEEVLLKARELAPGNSLVVNNLGHAYWLQGKMGLAIEAFTASLAMNPEQAGVASNLGAAMQECGRLEEAYQCYRQALKINPGLRMARSNLAFSLHYRHGNDPDVMFSAHKAWEGEAPVTVSVMAPIPKSHGQKLRIGYVSADLRTHSVGYFIESLLQNHDAGRFEIFCYSNSAVEDEVTHRLQRYVRRWRVIYGLDDDACRHQIRDDGIDILVDLSGHSDGGRMGVFLPRAAPIQVSFLGYPDTTGLSTMDARFVDAYTDPPGESDQYHTERLIRLDNGFLCYRPMEGAPAVSGLPAGTNGYVTFVCFNAFAKLSPQILGVWGRILQALPNAKLLLKSLSLVDESVRKEVEQQFLDAGIGLERVTFLGRVPSHAGHLEHYNHGDIALDPFPYNGTTTTFEALYMGLPVVSMSGRTHVTRVTGSILNALGHPEWVAEDEDEYLRIALDLAADVSRLAKIREGLRDELLRSELTDGVRYARKIEAAYQELWERALAEHGASPNVGAALPVRPERLHLGGLQARPGWTLMNIQPGPNVDLLGDITDLSVIEDASIREVYASHVLEHLGYQSRLPQALAEVYRVLVFDGVFYISVPDLDVLSALMHDDSLSQAERFQVMRMMYGGQVDPHDYHFVGLNFEILSSFLKDVGFAEIKRVDEFGLFDDTSSLQMYGKRISLNVIAVK